MNEDDRRARVHEVKDSQHAKAIIENPVWQRVFDGYVENLQAWMEEPGTEDDLVLEARRRLLSLRRVRKDLETALETGKLAEIQLREDQEKRLDRAAI